LQIKNELLKENIEKLLLEVDRLKSHGQLSDAEILIDAYRKKFWKSKRHTEDPSESEPR